MSHHQIFGYMESLDYAQLPGFEKLTEAQKQTVHETYGSVYRQCMNMGLKIAMGKAFENTKVLVAEMLKPVKVASGVPPSIFAGIDTI